MSRYNHQHQLKAFTLSENCIVTSRDQLESERVKVSLLIARPHRRRCSLRLGAETTAVLPVMGMKSWHICVLTSWLGIEASRSLRLELWVALEVAFGLPSAAISVFYKAEVFRSGR